MHINRDVGPSDVRLHVYVRVAMSQPSTTSSISCHTLHACCDSCAPVSSTNLSAESTAPQFSQGGHNRFFNLTFWVSGLVCFFLTARCIKHDGHIVTVLYLVIAPKALRKEVSIASASTLPGSMARSDSGRMVRRIIDALLLQHWGISEASLLRFASLFRN